MIRVDFDDGTEQDFITVEDARQGILDHFNESCGDDSPSIPQGITEVLRYFSVEWSCSLMDVTMQQS